MKTSLIIILLVTLAALALAIYGFLMTGYYLYLTSQQVKIIDMMHYLFDCGETNTNDYFKLKIKLINIENRIARLKEVSLFEFHEDEEEK